MKKLLSRALLLSVIGIAGLVLPERSESAALIGVDGVHGFGTNSFPASGSNFDTFRSVITGAGHTIVSLSSFTAGDLAGLDAIILMTPYSQNAHTGYSAAEISAIQAFVTKRAVFTSDAGMFSDSGAGSDRPISFGDNQLLLENTIDYIAVGGSALFLGDNGTGFNITNMNSLVGTYGVTYADLATDGDGRTVTGFVSHPVTSGISSLGVDFQVPMTVVNPAIDLTTGGGNDNILAVLELQSATIPEPATATLGLMALGGLMLRRRRMA